MRINAQNTIDFTTSLLNTALFNAIIDSKNVIMQRKNVMLNIVLCDDNRLFLLSLTDVVRNECEKIFPASEVINIGPSFENGSELIEHIKNNPVDVVLLDIDMPDMNGFEVAKYICDKHKDVKIVFTSAYDNFVYSSFEFHPFAYIRKSHIAEELPKVLSRISEKLSEYSKRLTLTTTSGIKTLEVNSIAYVESKRNYYSVYTTDGNEYVCRGTLTELEKQLKSPDFFRIHSAYLVNFEHIERMLEKGYLLVANASLPIAQKRGKEFKQAYMEYLRRSLGT